MEEKELPLGEHLEELRWRLVQSLASIILIALICYFLRDWILGFLISSYKGSSLIYIHPTEAFLTYLKLAGLSGLILSTPWILYQMWLFVRPALLEDEIRYIRLSFLLGGVLFYAGVGLTLVYGLPFSLELLSRIGEGLEMRLSVRNYVSFVSLLSFTVGLVFEVPLVLLVLVKLGFVTLDQLRTNRKYAIPICFTVAAFVTPTDLFSQALMATPLVLLYELSLIMIRFEEWIFGGEPQS